MPGQSGVILIVDDDPAAAELLTRFVEREGFKTAGAATAAEALAAHASTRPVAVLLDWELPDRPGSEVCRQIRDLDENVTIIFITGRGDETSVARALDAGA